MKRGKKNICMIIILIVIALFFGQSANALAYKYNMTYISVGDPANYSQLVDNTQDSLDEVSPPYFSLDADGNLIVNQAVSKSFVQEMHDQGVLVIPFLSNDWNRDKGIAAIDNRKKLCKKIAAAVSTYDLDGINIDIENLTPGERTDYVKFVQLLRAELPKDKTITVAVAANPSGTATGYPGSYDYKQLAKYCDYLMIMAYDESYFGSQPGPVASISFVEKSIKYALSVVSKDKIVLGLPFYGRIWSSSGGSPGGYGISNTEVETLVKCYNGTVVLDKTSQSARATITIKPADIKPIINGKALTAGTYVIWYSNAQSIKAELELVTKYDIKGAGSWSLGQETSNTWDYFKFWLNGCTFSDIQDNWAEDYILTAYLNGWMNGLSANSFSPATSSTRAQAAVVLVRMLGLSTEANSAYRFSDCGGHWAEAYIDTARKYGIVSGTGNNRFAPDRPVTREEIAVMFNNVLDISGSAGLTFFTDITKEGNSWSYGAISALNAQGVIIGYPDGSFRPGNKVTRAEISAMVSRMSDPVTLQPNSMIESPR